MKGLKCFKCHKRIEGGLNELSSHMSFAHALTLRKGHNPSGFICGQGLCRRAFLSFSSLRRHIEHTHRNLLEGGDESSEEESNEENLLDGNVNNVVGYDQMDDNSADSDVDAMIVDDAGNPTNSDFYLDTQVLRLICNLRGNSTITGATLTTVLDEFGELINLMTNHLKQQVEKFLLKNNLFESCPDSEELLKVFDIGNPFNKVRTTDKQEEALEKHFNFVKPVEVLLGDRIDYTSDGEPVKVYETCQYVPVIETLKLVLSNPEVKDAIEHEQSRNDGILASYKDGSQFKKSEFFEKYPNALRLQKYYDDFGVGKPLGAKSVIHKMGGFYFSIQNLPPQINSKLSSIHTLALCYEQDVRKYGFRKVLQPFLDDLKKLESDEGVPIQLGDENFVLRAGLVCACGDGLAIHQIEGLLSPSASSFCRACLIRREQLHAGHFMPGVLRFVELHREQLAQLQNSGIRRGAIETETGVREDSALSVSRVFETANNLSFDAMHDLLKGLCPMELKLVLHEYVVNQKLFSVDDFNGAVQSFDYGLDSKNKPCANFSLASLRNVGDHALKQTASQTWCLTRAFPFLVADKVQEGDEHLHLISLLLQIMEMAFSPKISIQTLPYFKDVIVEHHSLFLRLFPGVNMINKHHHVTHYPDAIADMGPLASMWCMRYEANHNLFKKHAHVVNCFKNLPKTLVRLGQCVQAAAWGLGDVSLSSVQTNGGSCAKVGDFPLLSESGLNRRDAVLTTPSVKLNGVNFKVSSIVCIDAGKNHPESYPSFAQIKKIFVFEDSRVYFEVDCFTTAFKDMTLNAYCVQTEYVERVVILSSNLAHYKPLSLWETPVSDLQFVSLRHLII